MNFPGEASLSIASRRAVPERLGKSGGSANAADRPANTGTSLAEADLVIMTVFFACCKKARTIENKGNSKYSTAVSLSQPDRGGKLAGHPVNSRIGRTRIISISAIVFSALVLFAGTASLGLWDPWEMNHSAVAWRMSGEPPILVIEKEGGHAIRDAVGIDGVKVESADVAGGSARGLDALRDRTSDRIFAAVIIDPSALVPDVAAPGTDPAAVKTLANAIRSAASRNLSTSFILVGLDGVDAAAVRDAVIKGAATEEDAPVDLDRALTAVSIGSSAELKRLVTEAASCFGSTAQFKSGGRTSFLPPLEPMITSLWFDVFGYNEFSARLTGVLFAVLTLALLVFGTRRLFSDAIPAGALFVLATSLLFYGTARFAGAGMAEVFFVALTALSFGQIVMPCEDEKCPVRKWGPWVLMTAGLVLCWLSGGMTAVVTAAAIAGTWFAVSPDRRHLPAVVAVFALLGVLAIATFIPEAAWFRQFRFTAATFTGGMSLESRTFDFIVKEIGFGFFPWSAFIPVAIWMAAAGSDTGRPARMLLLLWAVVPMVTAMVFIRPFGQTSYLGLPGMAMLTALFFRDFEDRDRDGVLAARIFGFFAAGLFLVIMKDMLKSPAPLVTFLTTDPMFSKPGQGDAGFPSTVQIPTIGKLLLALMLISILSVASRVSNIAVLVKSFMTGRKAFIAAVATAGGLILIDIIVFIALKWPALTKPGAGSEWLRIFLTGPDILALYLLLGIVFAIHWWDLIWARASSVIGSKWSSRLESAFFDFQTLKVQRPLFIACIAGFTAVQIFSVMPELSRHLSQKHIVDTWKDAARKEAGPLFRHGTFSSRGSEDSNFYTANIEEKASRSEVTSMLADKSRRTFFLVPTRQFSEINSAWRDQTRERGLPVLDDRSSRIVLTTSRLAPGEEDRNWLAKATLTESEFAALDDVERKVVNFDNSIELVGFSITPKALTRGTKPVLKTYYRVLRKIPKSYRVFLHVDKIGSSTRIHGDHWILNLVPESEDQDDCIGCYATNHWKKGDVIVDTYTLDVPIGSPAGDYDVWMGLYLPGGSRLKVVSFDEDKVRNDGSDRVRIGKMTVR